MAHRRDDIEVDFLPDDWEHQEFLDLTQNLNSLTQSEALKKQNGAGSPPEPISFEEEETTPSKHRGEPVPHYLSKTTYIQNHTFRRLFGLSIFFSFVYFALRVVYIAMNNVKVAVPADSTPETLRLVERQNRVALLYSTIILCAELGGFILVHVGQQMFTRQKTKFGKMPDVNVEKMKQVVADKGTLQNVHVIVCTYAEDAATVEKCVVHLLEATLPVYATRTIWVADDGHMKASGPGKRASCEKLAAAGHNVRYVGDRIRRAQQLNGKSSNLNHILLSHIYPDVNHSNEVSWKDIIVVMDCDHLVEPAYFQKCCSVLLNKDVAVCLVPQAFHNIIKPDFFDNRNANFMFRLMPYYFGSGCCFITGTNVMIRARTCFLACQFGETPTPGKRKFLHLWREKQANKRPRQLFSEVLIAEDIDLGSRIHALGYKSVFLDEVLALGEVPHAPRDFWKQRSRWHKAAHLYILDRHSVFWRSQPYMTFYQKSLYCIPMILHLTVFLSEPFMFTLPLLCLCFGVCPYGMDIWLWATHFLKLFFNFLISTHADTISGRVAALQAQTASRVLYFISVKAVLNTIMVYFRWKRPGAFKVTEKAGTASGVDTDTNNAPSVSEAPSEAASRVSSMRGPPSSYAPPDQYQMYRGHALTPQERNRPSVNRSSNRSKRTYGSARSSAGALAEGNERHMGGNRGRMYGEPLTQERVEASLRKVNGGVKSKVKVFQGSSHVCMHDPRPLSGESQGETLNGDSNPGVSCPYPGVSGRTGPDVSGRTGPEASAYEELMDGMTVETSATLESQATPGGFMVSSLCNVFGGKPTPEASPLGSPRNGQQHTAFSAHAQLQVQSNNGRAQLSNESVTTPDAPNPQYSPRERLASTSVLEELSDSAPLKVVQAQAQSHQVQPDVVQVTPLQNERQSAAARATVGAATSNLDSCTSAASVAFASNSLARNHQGVIIPQSQDNSQGLPAPPAHLQSCAPSRFSNAHYTQQAQHAEITSDRGQQMNQLTNPVGRGDIEGVVDKNSGESPPTTSIDISPASEGNTGTPLLPPRAASIPRGAQRQVSLPKQSSLIRTNSAPKRRHQYVVENNVYVPPVEPQRNDSFAGSSFNHPRTPSLVSMGSHGSHVGQHASDVPPVNAPPNAAGGGGGHSQYSNSNRGPNSGSEATSCVVPAPPPGYQYALVPTAPIVQAPPPGSTVQHSILVTHMPTPLSAVQEGHPMPPHELHRDFDGSLAGPGSGMHGCHAGPNIGQYIQPPSQALESMEGGFSSAFGMQSSRLLPYPAPQQHPSFQSAYSMEHPDSRVHSRGGSYHGQASSSRPPMNSHSFHSEHAHGHGHHNKGTSFHTDMPQRQKARTYDGNCEIQFHAHAIHQDAPVPHRAKARTYDGNAEAQFQAQPSHNLPRHPKESTYDANNERGNAHDPSFRSEQPAGRHLKTPSFNATRPSQTGDEVAVAGPRTTAGPVGEDQDESQFPPGYGCGFYCCHNALSTITEKRKGCMPYDGTLDFPVLFIITLMNLIALIYGTVKLAKQGEIISLRGTEEHNVKMIALVFALVEVTPGFLYLWYMVSFRCCRWTLWIVVPTTITLVVILVAFIEVRVGMQYITTALKINWQLPECTLSRCDALGGGASKQA